MNKDIIRAREMLERIGYTCVLVKDEIVYRSEKRGVTPLLEWLSSDIDLAEFSAADRVIGKAAALLFVLLRVKEVYSPIMSEQAVWVLERYEVSYSYDTLVDGILNRFGTGLCPMEQAVRNINDPHIAVEAVRNTLSQLKK